MTLLNGRTWTDDEAVHLRTLWDEGLSVIQISLKLHRSKNSVISKTHQLGLAPRQSPINHSTAVEDKPTRPRRPPPIIGSTLPPLPSQLAHATPQD